MGTFVGNINNWLWKIIADKRRPSPLMLSYKWSLKFHITFVNIVREIAAISQYMTPFNSEIVRGLPLYTLVLKKTPW